MILINTSITGAFMKTFDAPKDENGKPYWVPIVVKNRDYLVGFTEAYRLLANIYSVPLSELSKTISSDRFNDVLFDGSRIKDISKKELKEKVRNMIFIPDREEHVENDGEVYEQNLLTVECEHCGMFYSFKNCKEIPDVSTDCQICGRKLIIYTDLDDEDIEYEGEGQEVIENIVNEIHQAFFNDGDKENDNEI